MKVAGLSAHPDLRSVEANQSGRGVIPLGGMEGVTRDTTWGHWGMRECQGYQLGHEWDCIPFHPPNTVTGTTA